MKRLALRRFPDEIVRRRQSAGGRNQYGEFEPGTIIESVLPASVQPIVLEDVEGEAFRGGDRLIKRLEIYVPSGISRLVSKPDPITWNGDALLWNGAALVWGGFSDVFTRDDSPALLAAFGDRGADLVQFGGEVFSVSESRTWPTRTRNRDQTYLMRWPFKWKTEKRESGGDFSDAVVRLIEAQAAGTVADTSSTAAVESASGALSRAFASATVEGDDWARELVTPAFLAQVGRDLIRRGDSMHVIRMSGDGAIQLIPASSWHWEGNHDLVVVRESDRLRTIDVDHVELASNVRGVRALGQHARANLHRDMVRRYAHLSVEHLAEYADGLSEIWLVGTNLAQSVKAQEKSGSTTAVIA